MTMEKLNKELETMMKIRRLETRIKLLEWVVMIEGILFAVLYLAR